MKKFFSILAIATFVCLAATSCSKDSPTGSGTATYSFGASSMRDDGTIFLQISNIYQKHFATISGASISGSRITIEGKFSESDSKVLNACKAAEGEASQVKVEDPYYVTVSISAAYIGSDKYNDNFYSKTYGKKQ